MVSLDEEKKTEVREGVLKRKYRIEGNRLEISIEAPTASFYALKSRQLRTDNPTDGEACWKNPRKRGTEFSCTLAKVKYVKLHERQRSKSYDLQYTCFTAIRVMLYILVFL